MQEPTEGNEGRGCHWLQEDWDFTVRVYNGAPSVQ